MKFLSKIFFLRLGLRSKYETKAVDVMIVYHSYNETWEGWVGSIDKFFELKCIQNQLIFISHYKRVFDSDSKQHICKRKENKNIVHSRNETLIIYDSKKGMPSEVEIGVWVGGVQKWVTGVTRRTSCHDVIKALLRAQSLPARDSDVNDYVLMERWRKVERPLDHEQRILKVWKTWGETIQEVRFTLRRIKAEAPDASDSDTGSRVERIRRRHKWKQQQQQQQRQSEGNNRTSSEQRNSSNAGVAAFTSSSSASHRKHNGEDTKMNETMERLMRLVVAQGETIQTQLRRMQERDQQIENFEHQLHLFRVQNLGSDYLLQSYLKDPVGDAPQNTLHGEASAFVKEEEKSNDSGVVTEELCDNDLRPSHLEKPLNKSQQSSISFEELEDIRNRTILLDKLDKNRQLAN
ncbi:Ras association domain-containing protein 9 [Armadillidium nasatum]|uniref:Ras association domain-containing protein 9 n=1 Tax=Armadillidium nasatum TaxID=96803 RepID=A0A5N5SN15_9CRUS|nr:Ras association domain-containing protein 9 [Armadillidium nasatum]